MFGDTTSTRGRLPSVSGCGLASTDMQCKAVETGGRETGVKWDIPVP